MAIAPDANGWVLNEVDGVYGLYRNGTLVVEVQADGDVKITGNLGTDGKTPVQAGGWAITSFTEDKEFAGNSTTAADAVKGLASLVNDLINLGIIDGTVSA